MKWWALDALCDEEANKKISKPLQKNDDQMAKIKSKLERRHLMQNHYWNSEVEYILVTLLQY